MESQLDFATGTYGKVSNVIVHFTRITGGDDTGKWNGTEAERVTNLSGFTCTTLSADEVYTTNITVDESSL